MNYKKTSPFLIILLVAISVLTFFASCEEEGISEAEGQSQFHRESQLRNTYDNGIVPLLDSFISSTTSLRDAALNFSENKTEDQLENTQRVWFETLSIWKNIELFEVGDIADSFIHFQINEWPSNTEFIDDFIAGEDIINETFIASRGASSKGISGAEYLLYAEETTTETLATFISADNAERRTSYLIAITENLIANSQELKERWEAYAPTFYSSLESGLDGSQNQLANAMITLSEQIVIRKLGNALGDQTGGNIDITELENFRSEVSLESIEQNVQTLYDAYTGNYRSDIIPWGFDDFLFLVNADSLDQTIRASFEENLSAISSIQGSLIDNLESNPDQIIALQSSLNELEVLIKVDMANALGATVTVNSNDGD